jgi:hypothetical protein
MEIWKMLEVVKTLGEAVNGLTGCVTLPESQSIEDWDGVATGRDGKGGRRMTVGA